MDYPQDIESIGYLEKTLIFTRPPNKKRLAGLNLPPVVKTRWFSPRENYIEMIAAILVERIIFAAMFLSR